SDARRELADAGIALFVLLVETGQKIESRALVFGCQVLRRGPQVEDRIARRAEYSALIGSRQISGSPIIRAVIGAAAVIEDDDKRGQVLVLGTEPIGNP